MRLKITTFLLSSLIYLGLAQNNIAAKNINSEFPKAHRSFLGITLEKSTIEDVKNVFGYSEPWQRQDKKHDPYTHCYKLSGSDRNAWIIIRFGWYWSFERVDSVIVTFNADEVDGRAYGTLVTLKSIMTDGGLRLGISPKAAQKLIPGKPVIKGKIYKYDYETYLRYEKPKKPQGDKGFTYVGEYRYGIIEFTAEKNKIIRFHVWASGEPDW